jgi:hypothetical protein
MPLRTFIAGALVVSCFGLLGFRILDLEQRVAALSAQLGEAPATSGAEVRAIASSGARTTCDQRLDALERRLARANTSPTRNPGEGKQGAVDAHDEAAILSVVERENSRIRDVQLEFSRSRWLEARDGQLAAFASMLQLQTPQIRELRSVLEREVDHMVETLKRPGIAEDPDQFASDWNALLSETDRGAERVLTPEQMLWWNQARGFERQTLWPWLPKDATAQR